MSTNLSEPACAKHGVETEESSLMNALMASGGAHALVNTEARVVQASQALETLIPGIPGRSIVDVFSIDHTLLDEHATPYTAVSGVYTSVHGENVPAVLQTIAEMQDTGNRLISITDGAPFRQAESHRFESTPYAIMRVSPDGIIHFANPEAHSLLSGTPGQLTGCSLATFFDTRGEAAIQERIGECLKTHDPVSMNVSMSSQTNENDETVRLILTPDLTADLQPLGVLVVVQSTLVERVRNEIARFAHDSTLPSWQKRLQCIIESVRKIFDFDHANFGIYADDISVFRALAIFPRDYMKWSERWLRLPPDIGGWLKSGKTAVPDIDQFLKQFPSLRQSEVAQMYISKSMRSSVTLVAAGAKNVPTSALTFCSKEVGSFSQEHVDLLRNLHLEPVLIRIENEIRAERESLAARLRRDLSSAESLPDVARSIVNQIAASFKWEFVALFRVDRQMQQFELFHHNPCKKTLAFPSPYFQPIKKGMLAATLRENLTLVVNDIGAPDVNQYDYIGLDRLSRSAMTIPVQLNGRTRWILNIESEVAHAFHGPDREAVEQLTRSLEEGLAQRTLKEINKIVLKETEQGVVTVGMDGAILGMNSVAEGLLGRSRKSASGRRRQYISQYASPDDLRAIDVLKGVGATEKRRIELVDDDGEVRPVLATRKVLDPSFDTALWFLIDLQGDRWTVDLRFLRETVTDVAQQTRAPLALASSFVRQLSQSSVALGSMPDSNELFPRLMSEIKKADITFERLAENLNVRREPVRNLQRVDLRYCINSVIDDLPERDRNLIEEERAQTPVVVSGDPERLIFAVRSIVAHLLRVLPANKDARVHVVLRSRSADVAILLATTEFADMDLGVRGVDSPEGNARPDALWHAYETARGDASLGLGAVQCVIDAHGGTLDARAGSAEPGNPAPPWVAFRIVLPIENRSALS